MATIDDLHLGDRLLSEGVLNEGQLLECFRILRERKDGSLADLLAERGVVPRSSDDTVTLISGGRAAPADAGGATRTRRVFGRYLLLQALGQGGFGVVHRAYDQALGRVVALKRMRSRDPVLVERFQHEARAAARLSHPGIVPVYDVGEVAGVPYYTMELVPGRTLQELLRGGLLTRREAVALVRDVARAAHAAHDAGIIHRDLKPGNVLVGIDEERPPGAEGRVSPARVTDFGLAKDLSGSDLTVSGQILGTPAYMSPEQASGAGRRVDRRSDVYSLGAILYEALVGVPPFTSEDPHVLLARIVREDPVPPRRLRADVPLDLETIALKALEKDPARRYPDAGALADELDRWLTGLPVLARPLSRAERLLRWVGRNRLKSAAVLLALLAVANPVVIAVHARISRRAEAARLRDEGVARTKRALEALRALPPPPQVRGSDEAEVRRAERLAEDRMQAVRDGADVLAKALALDPGDETARDALADAWFALSQTARARGATDQASLYERLVSLTAATDSYRARYESAFRRRGTLQVRISPTGARASLLRYEEAEDTRLVARPCPLSEDLAEGSYLLKVEAEGRPPVLRPLRVQAGGRTEVEVHLPEGVPQGFVYVPGGEYTLPVDLSAAEGLTTRAVRVGSFFLARDELTFEEYMAFVEALRATDAEAAAAAYEGLGNDRPERRVRWLVSPRSPVCGVDSAQVRAYLAWRSARDGKAWRLPTEDEWEVAARGADGRRYPWGSYFRPGFAATRQTVLLDKDLAVEVGMSEADVSPFGVRDLAGGASEWTSSPVETLPGWFIVKGGSWGWDVLYTRAASRIECRPAHRDNHIGFRLAADAE